MFSESRNYIPYDLFCGISFISVGKGSKQSNDSASLEPGITALDSIAGLRIKRLSEQADLQTELMFEHQYVCMKLRERQYLPKAFDISSR